MTGVIVSHVDGGADSRQLKPRLAPVAMSVDVDAGSLEVGPSMLASPERRGHLGRPQPLPSASRKTAVSSPPAAPATSAVSVARDAAAGGIEFCKNTDNGASRWCEGAVLANDEDQQPVVGDDRRSKPHPRRRLLRLTLLPSVPAATPRATTVVRGYEVPATLAHDQPATSGLRDRQPRSRMLNTTVACCLVTESAQRGRSLGIQPCALSPTPVMAT